MDGSVVRVAAAGLRLLNPEQVYNALISDQRVIDWLTFIAYHYKPTRRELLLLYPCTAVKPYSSSRSYKALYKTLAKLGDKRQRVHLITISEPFGLIPQEFQRDGQWDYDCPGLFRWWCIRNGQPFSKEKLDKSIEILAKYTAEFLKRVHREGLYCKAVAFVRTYSSSLSINDDHTHRRIIEKASEISNVIVDILPPKELVAKIVTEKGRLAWDMYGVAHPIAQDYLLNYLNEALE